MGNFINIIELMPTWQIVALVIGLPLLAIGLFYLLRLEFRNRSAKNLSGFLTILSLVLVQNEVKIHYYLSVSDAQNLMQEADQLWGYRKYRESYEKLEQAVRVAKFQNDNEAMIMAYNTITDRYFRQNSYQNPTQYTDWEMRLIERSLGQLQENPENQRTIIDKDSVSPEQVKSFYNRLYEVDVLRNDPFADSLYYLSTDRLGFGDNPDELIRAAYQRALIVITQSVEAGNPAITSSSLGKFYSAASKLEESRNNLDLAYVYISNAIEYWDDYQAKIQAARLAFKLGHEEEAHAFINDIRFSHEASGRLDKNEIYVLEAAALEFSHDHLEHAREIYTNLQNQLSHDLENYQHELDRINQDHLASVETQQALIYPFLDNVRSIRTRIRNIDNHLVEIRSRYAEKAILLQQQSTLAHIEGDLKTSISHLYKAIDLAKNAQNRKYQFMYHVRAAKLLNSLNHFEDAVSHLVQAQNIHDGDNDVLINEKRDNDIALHYPVLLVSQLGLQNFDDAATTLETLYTLGKSREYTREPNKEYYEYLKGRVLFYAQKNELLRAENYFDDAVDYLIQDAKRFDIHLTRDVEGRETSANNLHERYLTELLQLRSKFSKSDTGHDFQTDKMQQH